MVSAANFGSLKGVMVKIFKVYNMLQILHNFAAPLVSVTCVYITQYCKNSLNYINLIYFFFLNVVPYIIIIITYYYFRIVIVQLLRHSETLVRFFVENRIIKYYNCWRHKSNKLNFLKVNIFNQS